MPSDEDVANGVAATIYSVWRARVTAATVGRALAPFGLSEPRTESELVALKRILSGEAQSSGLDFFASHACPMMQTKQAIILLQSPSAALDRLASPDFAAAFAGSTDQPSDRWGLLHRVTLDSPLGGSFSVPPAFRQFPAPLAGLPGIPVDGGYGTVDAASHDARANGPNGFMFGSGPVRRYVGLCRARRHSGRVRATRRHPGRPGRRPPPGPPAALLTNDYYPARLAPSNVAAGTESVLELLPD